VLKEWTSGRQQPEFQGRGDAYRMLPNPLFTPGAPEEVVEPLRRASRGGAGVSRAERNGGPSDSCFL
jgi:hypothetical protein